MKKITLFVLAVALVISSVLFVSCSPKEEIEVAANVKVVDGDGEVILDTAVLVKAAEPTVLMAITQACQESDIKIENNGTDVTSINGLEEYDDEEALYFWDCTIDKKGIEGKAANFILTNDKEHTIIYTFSSVEKQITDDEGNVVTEEDEEAE